MSMSSLDNDDLDPDNKPESAPETNAPRSITSRAALVTAMLDQLDTSAIRQALRQTTPQMVLIEAASAQWARGISTVIDRRYERVYASAVIDLKKDGNAGLGKDLLEHLHRQRHLVICTHDAASFLPADVRSAADFRLVVPAADLATVRHAIRLFTGRAPRGLTEADFAGLDFEDLALALRSGSNATACVKRLRQATAQSKAMSDDTSKAKTIEELPLSEPVAAWAKDLLAQMRDVELGVMPSADLPYGLLHGPAGTGKTTIAAAVAQSAGWRFVPGSMSEWFTTSDGHLGGVSRAIKAFIDDVLSEPKTVGFIDEIETVPNRATLDARDREWWTPVVTLVLLQIDRVRRSGKPALLLAATNYPERLDASLTRSGRIERHVAVLPPDDEKEVAAILRFYLGEALTDSTLAEAARLGLGASAATIGGWVRMARATARSAGRDLESADLLAAVAPPDGRGVDELYATALHEAGHAVVALHLGIGVHSASILSGNATGGNIRMLGLSTFPDRDELERTVTAFLGGRAADMVLGKGPHAGAQLDLEMATRLLARGTGEFGLYDTLAYRGGGMTDRELFREVDVVLKRLLHRAIGIVEERQAQVKTLAGLLMKHRVLDEGLIGDALAGTTGRVKEASRRPKKAELVNNALINLVEWAQTEDGTP